MGSDEHSKAGLSAAAKSTTTTTTLSLEWVEKAATRPTSSFKALTESLKVLEAGFFSAS